MKLQELYTNQTVIESSLNRIRLKAEDHPLGTITAFRGWILVDGEQQKLTKKDNLARNKVLLAKIQNRGYEVTTIKGSYIEQYGKKNAKEVGETTFLVVNPEKGDDDSKLQKDLIKWGKEFEQDSVLIKPFGKDAFLYGTSDREDAYPEYGKKEPFSKLKFGKEGEFFSRVKGRPFSFESIEQNHGPSTINGKRGISILANKNWKDLV